PGNDGGTHPGALERSDQCPCPGGELDLTSHALHDLDRQPLQHRHPLTKGLGEVQATLHRSVGDLTHFRCDTRLRRPQVDHFVLDQGGVDGDDDQPLHAPLQTLLLDCDVEVVLGRRQEEVLPQRGEVATGDHELIGDHRVSGESDDAIDVAARLCDGGSGGTESGRSHSAPDDRDRGGERWRGWGRFYDLELDLKTRLPPVEEQILDGRLVFVDREQDVECQPAPDHDLFDVVELRPRGGEDLHQPCGDARTVGTVDPAQDGRISRHESSLASSEWANQTWREIG